MKSVQINDNKLYDQIVEYCKLNSLKVSDFITEMVRKQFMIEKYGDTPFTTYETTIINYNPVSSLTVDVIIEKPIEDELIKNAKTNDEITNPSIVSVPYTIEENSPLITNCDTDLNKKQKPKKRRL